MNSLTKWMATILVVNVLLQDHIKIIHGRIIGKDLLGTRLPLTLFKDWTEIKSLQVAPTPIDRSWRPKTCVELGFFPFGYFQCFYLTPKIPPFIYPPPAVSYSIAGQGYGEADESGYHGMKGKPSIIQYYGSSEEE